MSLFLIVLLVQVAGVSTQSTLLDSQCENDCNLEHNVEIQTLATMMQNMRGDMSVMKDANERSQRKIIELVHKNDVLENRTMELVNHNNVSVSKIKLLEDELKRTISNLQAKIIQLESENKTSNVDGSMNFDCEDLRARGYLYSGVYELNVTNVETHRVYCEMTSDGKAWTRIMHRQDNLTDFTYKKWVEYEAGFGNLQGSHWMGLIMMNKLTTNKAYKLRVDLMDWEGDTRYAEYTTFHVGSASDKYRLSIAGYNGTAGDSMTSGLSHNNMLFTTIDNDNDRLNINCADGAGPHTGGWWYYVCFNARLTGTYFEGGDVPRGHGIQWPDWRGRSYSYKVATMKIQRL